MAGLQILIKHKPNGDMSAERDKIYCEGPTKEMLSEGECRILRKNGWMWDGNFDLWYKSV